MTEQTVVDETKVSAKPDTTVETRTDETDPLDALLAEYDQGTKKPDATTQTPVTPKIDPTEVTSKIQNLEAIAQNWQRDQDRKAMSETIESIRGDIPKEVFDDDMIEGWLNALAVKDQRLATAYIQREQNPRAWNKVKAELKGKLAEKIGKLPDLNATVDRELVAQSVRGASKTTVAAEPPPKLGSMTEAEFRKYKRENFGFE